MESGEYNEHSMNATVSRIETKLDIALNGLADQNRRLAALETAENKRVGALVAIGAICSTVTGAAVMLFDHLKGK